jgi:hypothetical protein
MNGANNKKDWPVDPGKYPLSGPSYGQMYKPPEVDWPKYPPQTGYTVGQIVASLLAWLVVFVMIAGAYAIVEYLFIPN